MSPPFSFWGVYKIPLTIAVISIVGLTCGVLADGVWDVVSWVGLGTPVLIIIVAYILRPISGNKRSGM